MAGNKQIKMTEEEFNETVLHIKTHTEALITGMNELIQTNSDMKSDWIGDGGNAFILTAKIIEEEFNERIKDFQRNVTQIENTKNNIINLDGYLANQIENSIDGKKPTFGVKDDNSDNTMRIKLN